MSEGRETNDSQSYNSNDYDEHDEEKVYDECYENCSSEEGSIGRPLEDWFRKNLNVKEKNANTNLIQTSAKIK